MQIYYPPPYISKYFTVFNTYSHTPPYLNTKPHHPVRTAPTLAVPSKQHQSTQLAALRLQQSPQLAVPGGTQPSISPAAAKQSRKKMNPNGFIIR